MTPNMLHEMDEKVLTQHWDVIVIGTGMGGATIGYSLAKSGKRVLFCEEGLSPLDSTSLKGRYAETFFAHVDDTRKSILKRSGRWTELIEDRTTNTMRGLTPCLGVGCGGSTALYGGVLERLREVDFNVTEYYKNFPVTSVVAWPITYKDLERYYEEAEKLFCVKGDRDPLYKKLYKSELPPITNKSAVSKKLRDYFVSSNLHPYVLPRSLSKLPDDSQGFLDDKGHKITCLEACLLPAIQKYSATLLSSCKVLKINADGTRATSVTCEWKNKTITLHGSTIILSAGALGSPALLLKSASADFWPNGLGNSSGLVGKNLMRHFVDLFVFSIRGMSDDKEYSYKELTFNDWYITTSNKLGNIQAFGAMLPLPYIVEFFIGKFTNYSSSISPKLINAVVRLIQPVFNMLFRDKQMYASIVEDLPYENNRVYLDDQTMCINYEVHDSDLKRIQEMRSLVKSTFAPLGVKLIKQAENNNNLAHVVGTCRFGTDPKKSVLDPNNKMHDLQNVYVVDGSFFPTSGGVNPSLTIAANALRVADHIIRL
jgi:choline dehydrogenase-like flavoprotein